MGDYKAGDVVKYVDRDGNVHNALVIYVWQTCLNIAYVDPEVSNDSYGNAINKETSVPFEQEGMSGNYIK